VPHAEHPLIAAHGTDAAADLVGERLDTEPIIGSGERAGDGVVGAIGGLRGEKFFDGFFETALSKWP